jgi:hypothetical protein
MSLAAPRGVFIVVRGRPRAFSDLTAAEHVAAELCERDREDYSILAVPDGTLSEKTIVATWKGVVLSTLSELGEDEEN